MSLKQKAQSIIETMAANRMAELRGMLHPEVRLHVPKSSEEKGFPATVNGPDAIIDAITGSFARHYVTFHVSFLKIIGEGDTVALMYNATGRTHSGKDYANRYLYFMTFKDELLFDAYECTDTAYAFTTF